jgi:hypothetical protein
MYYIQEKCLEILLQKIWREKRRREIRPHISALKTDAAAIAEQDNSVANVAGEE